MTDRAGRKHAENELHARPAIRITVGHRDAEITGCDNRALQAAVDYVGNLGGGVAEGNWLENNGGYGMSIGHMYSDNFVRQNTIIGHKRGGVYWRAEAEPMAAHRVTFEQNTVRDNEGWGLFVDGATTGTVFRSNLIEDTGAGCQKTRIRRGQKAGDVTLEDNRIKADKPVKDERPGR